MKDISFNFMLLKEENNGNMADSENKQVLKCGIGYIIGNFLLKGIGFLTTPVFTRIMSQEDIGDFSNIITWVGVATIVATFDLRTSVSIAKFDFKGELNRYIGSLIVLGTIIPLTFFLSLLPLKDKMLSYIGAPDYVYYLGFAYLIFNQVIEIFQAESQVTFKYKASLAVSIITALSSSLLSILLVFSFEDKLMGRFLGYYIPFIIIGCIIYIKSIRAADGISHKYWKYALNISFPLVFHLLGAYVLSSSDKLMIYNFDGNKSVGLYSVAYSSAMIINVLMTSMNSAWTPWSIQQIDSGKDEQLRKASKIYIIFFGILVYAIVLLGPEILMIMGGRNYMEAKWVIPPVMIGVVFQFINSFYVNIEQYYKKQKITALGTVLASITNIILNYIFIPMYGYIAAAYTTLISYIILFIVHFIFVKRIKKSNIYDSKYNISFLLISFFVLFLANLLYNYNGVRIIAVSTVLLLILSAVVKNRRVIIDAIKTKSLSPILEMLRAKRLI